MHKRYIVTVWHGELRSLFYVVDTEAPCDERPAICSTWHDRAGAEREAAEMNANPEK